MTFDQIIAAARAVHDALPTRPGYRPPTPGSFVDRMKDCAQTGARFGAAEYAFCVLVDAALESAQDGDLDAWGYVHGLAGNHGITLTRSPLATGPDAQAADDAQQALRAAVKTYKGNAAIAMLAALAA